MNRFLAKVLAYFDNTEYDYDVNTEETEFIDLNGEIDSYDEVTKFTIFPCDDPKDCKNFTGSDAEYIDEQFNTRLTPNYEDKEGDKIIQQCLKETWYKL
ncbi:hypothetical protein [Moorena sp. SIO2C4]|uniref:hypothetical protein n=1 Tax=Moorena sp. SIO2C4 TaxID=2607824 RepID=UPI0013C94542|nr:hypothetical protein [Moorena sp. SIO2C4]NES40544.1 hypothetical protein [Moorena sp. SIO2C4]